MSRLKFGQLVAALRKEKFDPNSGSYWSQETLASATGISARIIATIEQGTKTKLETDTLLVLAKALQLNTLETRSFLQIALTPENAKINSIALTETYRNLIELIKTLQLPALLYDDYLDILAVNSLSVAFNIGVAQSMGITSPFPIPQDHNLLCLLFNPESEHQQRLAPMWTIMARTCVQMFHCHTLRHRSTPYFQSLLSQLRRYPVFRQYWEEICDAGSPEINCYHPFTIPTAQNEVAKWSNSVTTTVTPIADLHLAMVLPCNQAAFEALGVGLRAVPPEVYQLEEWPTVIKFPELASN